MKLVNAILFLLEAKPNFKKVDLDGKLDGLVIRSTSHNDFTGIEDFWDALSDSEVEMRFGDDDDGQPIITIRNKASIKALKTAVAFIVKKGGRVSIKGL